MSVSYAAYWPFGVGVRNSGADGGEGGPICSLLCFRSRVERDDWVSRDVFDGDWHRSALPYRAAARLCSRFWRLMRHRSREDLKPLFEDESFVFELWAAIVLGMVFMLKPDVLAPFTTPPTTFTEQVAEQAGLTALSCPTLALDDTIATMPRQDRYECEYVDGKGRAHDMSLLVASGDKVWLYGSHGNPMKVGK